MLPLFAALLPAVLVASLTYILLGLAPGRAGPTVSDVGRPTSPPSVRGRAVALAAGGLALAGAVLVVLSQAIDREDSLVRWDSTVETWASDHAGTASTRALLLITHLGGTVTIVAFGVVGCAWLFWMRQRRLALFLACVVAGQWLLSNLLKVAVARDRPALDPLAPFDGFSFPSGHSTASAATYLALALIVNALHAHRNQRLQIAIGVGIGVAVAASRALLGVHWFSDVVGGLLLGWTWCLACASVIGVVGRHRSSAVGQ